MSLSYLSYSGQAWQKYLIKQMIKEVIYHPSELSVSLSALSSKSELSSLLSSSILSSEVIKKTNPKPLNPKPLLVHI
jgi:hypothetical protein